MRKYHLRYPGNCTTLKTGVLLLAMLLSLPGHAQEKNADKEKAVSLVPIPFIGYNRTQKLEYGVLPLLMFPIKKQDTISPQSMAGGALVFTTNGSFYFFGFSRLYWQEDTWRATLAAGTGDQDSQTYLEAIDIPEGLYDYSTEFSVIHAELQYRMVRNLFVGSSFTHTVARSALEEDPSVLTNNVNNGISASLSSDTRDNVYYPVKGELMNLRWINYPSWLANDTQANKITLEVNKYIPLKNKPDVLALRGSMKAGIGDIDFEQQQIIGKKDIRGYSQGEFRGDGKIALQGEYRKNFRSKFGLVGFFGIATLYGSENPDHNWKAYPAIGTGVRYTIFKKNHLNIGLDAAIGDGDWGVYFRIGEAF